MLVRTVVSAKLIRAYGDTKVYVMRCLSVFFTHTPIRIVFKPHVV